jgi:hypothetical protein
MDRVVCRLTTISVQSQMLLSLYLSYGNFFKERGTIDGSAPGFVVFEVIDARVPIVSGTNLLTSNSLIRL